MNKEEKILLCVFLVLSSVVVSYNLFYISNIPNLDIVKEEFVVKESQKTENSQDSNKTLININTASEEELTKIPGVGASISKRIIEYREQNGGFSSVEEIMNVSGIGKSKFESMKNSITV